MCSAVGLFAYAFISVTEDALSFPGNFIFQFWQLFLIPVHTGSFSHFRASVLEVSFSPV